MSSYYIGSTECEYTTVNSNFLYKWWELNNWTRLRVFCCDDDFIFHVGIHECACVDQVITSESFAAQFISLDDLKA
jgi:hypothetical protein